MGNDSFYERGFHQMKSNRKGVLCLTFDNMGHAAAVGRREVSGPDANEKGLLIGYPNILALLTRLDLTATFFIEGWNALHHPHQVRELVDRGHDVGLHGWTHETFHQLEEVDAERVLIDSLAAFRAIGIEPQGFRAPGGVRGPYAVPLLKKLGIHFDSSVDELADRTEPQLLDENLPNVPWLWPMIDYYQYFMHPEGPRTPQQLEEYWTEALEDAALHGTTVTFIIHAFVSGTDQKRLDVITRLLEKAKAHPNLEILTARQAAERVKNSVSEK
jgi:peptidoglycan/xylan/chitin deacetylase (PgdA/CDA1 family)